MTLTEFLLARIDEDEVVVFALDLVCPPGTRRRERLPPPVVTPDRVLAECKAKRRIVELHGNDWNPRGKCEACDEVGPCDTLHALALPYADHPDYDEAWRP